MCGINERVWTQSVKTRLVVSSLRLMCPDLCVSGGNSMGSECGWQVPATGCSGSGQVHRFPYLVLAGEALLKDSSHERWVGGGFCFCFSRDSWLFLLGFVFTFREHRHMQHLGRNFCLGGR